MLYLAALPGAVSSQARPRPTPKATAVQIVAHVGQTYGAAQSAVVTFEQGAGRDMVRGTLEVSGDRYRLETPERTVVADGTTSWLYDPAQKRVMIDAVEPGTTTLTPARLLTEIPTGWRPTLVGTTTEAGSRVYQLSLMPPRPDPTLERMTLWVAERGWTIRRVAVQTRAAGALTYRVASVDFKPSLPAARFSFTAPAGVKVVDLR